MFTTYDAETGEYAWHDALWSISVRFTNHPRWVNIKKAKKMTKWEAK